MQRQFHKLRWLLAGMDQQRRKLRQHPEQLRQSVHPIHLGGMARLHGIRGQWKSNRTRLSE